MSGRDVATAVFGIFIERMRTGWNGHRKKKTKSLIAIYRCENESINHIFFLSSTENRFSMAELILELFVWKKRKKKYSSD